MSSEMRSLLEGLLQRDVDKRLGCLGRLWVIRMKQMTDRTIDSISLFDVFLRQSWRS